MMIVMITVIVMMMMIMILMMIMMIVMMIVIIVIMVMMMMMKLLGYRNTTISLHLQYKPVRKCIGVVVSTLTIYFTHTISVKKVVRALKISVVDISPMADSSW